MKSNLLLLILSFIYLFPLCADATEGKFVVNVSESGNLINLIGIDNIDEVKGLTVSGDLNGTDILTIRKMTNLEILDMSNSNIVGGGSSYYLTYTTSANQIGDYFFKEKTNLSTILLPKTITSIGNYSFQGCNKIVNIAIPLGVTIIGQSAFDGCSGLKKIILPNSVKTISNDAFSDCDKLAEISIPNSVTSIGGTAFYGCNGLKNIILEDGATTLYFSANSFNNCPIENLYMGRNFLYSPFKSKITLTELIIGNSVTNITGSAFSGCTGLTSLTIPNSVETIGQYAFDGCSGLTGTLSIPNSVKSIIQYAFRGCSGLTGALYIPNSVETIGQYAFYDCSKLTELKISNSVASIGQAAFEGCNGLRDVVLEDGTEILSMGDYTFNNCPIERLYLGRDITYYSDNSPFRDITALTNLTIGNSVTSITRSAFYGCNGLTKISIPNSVVTIEDYAFQNCRGLKSMVLEDGAICLSFKTNGISSTILENCPIESLYMGRDISSSSSPFRNKTTLTELIIGDSVTFIEKNAFDGCNGLTKTLSIPNFIKSIGDYAFRACSGLEELNISNSVISIGGSAFQNCTGLTTATIGISVTSIENNAFSGCSNLIEINSQNPIPPQAQSNTFEGVDKENCILYVPTGCTTIYWLHPVWEDFFNIKEKDFPTTSINPINADNISAFITDEGLNINGCNPNDSISIYTIGGKMIYKSNIGDGLINYSFQKGNVYIVHTPKKTLKILY